MGTIVVSLRIHPVQAREVDKICNKLGWSRSEFFQNNLNLILHYWQEVLREQDNAPSLDKTLDK